VANSFWGSPTTPIAIAHRGGGARFGEDKHHRENTLEAFEGAVKLGYKYLETDVIYTKDNQLIVLHVAKNRFEAARRQKEAPSYYRLQKLTYEEIKNRLGRNIPTLKELLLAYPQEKFFIDPKSDAAVEPLAQTIQELKALDRVTLLSFYVYRLKKLRRLLGAEANLGLIISRYPKFMNRNLFMLNQGAYNQIGLETIGLPKMLCNSKVVASLHKRGFKVTVWTLNSRSEINSAINCGADGIISDDITLLKQELGESF
jgi:glycerophosphoryl diester phosphodiesterase